MNLVAHNLVNDRLTMSFMLAVALHVVVLVFLGFQFAIDRLDDPVDTLDVVLVNWRSEAEPEEAEFLAQATQVGGGDTAERARPASAVSGLTPNLEEGEALLETEAAAPAPSLEAVEVVTTEQASERAPTELTREEVPETPPVSAAELLLQSQQMARMEPELSRAVTPESKQPRREFISANTREFEYASYMRAWVAKVERVGNLNYPEQTRGLAGDLLLTVGVRADGSVESIDLRRSSGVPELDEAAMRIVRLAAPYAPLPEHIAERVDVLHITRTWRFSSGSRFSTGGG